MKAWFEQLAIAHLCHPPGAGKMGFIDGSGPIRLDLGVEAEDYSHNFLPVCAFGICIQQAQVGDEMAFIIAVDPQCLRRAVIEGRNSHCTGPPAPSARDLTPIEGRVIP